MNGKTKRCKRMLAAVNTLTSNGKTNAKLVKELVNNELAGVLNDRKLKKIKLERAIFSHLESGLVISGPVSVPRKVAKSHSRKKPRPVGFLLNTMRLVDPVSRRALEPGATLVEMRPLPNGGFAFDYIGGDGKVKMATPTHPSGNRGGLIDPGGGGPDPQGFDIEVNHVIIAPTPDDFLPCNMVCTSYHDGTEACHYACNEDDDLGFTIAN